MFTTFPPPMTGQEIINQATSHITAENNELLPDLHNTNTHLTAMDTAYNAQMADTNDDDEDSVIEDLLRNYISTVVDVENTEDTQLPIPEVKAIPETPPPQMVNPAVLPAQLIPVEQPPCDPFVSQPIVRVALLDFNFKPTPGEIYQVNSEGHLLKLSLKKGMVFQVNNMGGLQEVTLPFPVKQE
jgi:hypothetical protein